MSRRHRASSWIRWARTALLFSSSALAEGGAKTAAPPGAPTTITLVGWGMPEERAIVRAAIARFERRHPDIHVAYTQVPGVGYDYLNKLRLMIVARKAPDVFYVPDGAFGAMVSQGVLRDLDDFVAKSETIRLDDMWPSVVARYRWDG